MLVVGVNHCNGDQYAQCLKQNRYPFNCAHCRFAYNNALASGHPTRYAANLSFQAWLIAEYHRQVSRQRRYAVPRSNAWVRARASPAGAPSLAILAAPRPQYGGLSAHQSRALFLWKIAGEQNYGTQRAGLGGNGSLCLIERVPDFDCDEADHSAKRTPTGNKPGDTALKARAHSVSASLVTTRYTPPAMKNWPRKQPKPSMPRRD